MLRKLAEICSSCCCCCGCCENLNDDDNMDYDQQRVKEQQLIRRYKGRITRIPHSLTESTLASALNTVSSSSNMFIKRRTPVLFCTNRGLHLRVAKVTSSNTYAAETYGDSNGDSEGFYDISFCDLERWSTNRAYTVSLEDTFTIARRTLEPVEEHPTSSTSKSSSKNNGANRNLGGFSQCYNGSLMNGYVPVKKRSLYYDNSYTRFETGKLP